ncbi:BTAD domain-containing putative transcriptional regulator [Amycolatopsis saalfeldensis]|uniref:Predicted ATPase n=1 Tax=Amycolatopsis saalfeldensis TaxID=394193 RepID=A0A1H8Y552_9PSEU|nr:BTAD domain-containing putative transcriptional regulator [Amycolatopsis saalfeldensis]SEP47420.1 Predicted ATPase [Amycolatopsis saalfeldensis]
MRISLLGPLDVRTEDGAAVEVAGARLRALLTALALEPGRVVASARLVDAVWGEHPPGTANALQALVSRLRKAGIAPDSTPTGYRLAAETDVARFEELLTGARGSSDADTARLLREALNLWRGPVPADGEYFQAPLARLAELRLTAVEEHAEASLRLGAGAALTGELAELLAEHPLRERLASALMRALCAAARPAEALTVYERTRRVLAEELGADPSGELAELHASILRGSTAFSSAAFDSAAFDSTVDESRTNLRAGLTSFVGRDADVTVVAKLVGEYRLTTLIGPGGAGKTRLATETARTLLDEADGVWLVELAPVTDGADVAQAVLTALGLRGQGYLGPAAGTPRDRAVAALRTRNAVLVLDNCEHVIDAAAELADALLGECPRLRILATSREALAVTGEALWPVEPLALPSEDSGVTEAMSCASVRLFADRAAAVRPGFTVDATTVGAVAGVCRALDGMPLAVELAAARLRALTADQLAARLDDRFRLFTGGSRTALPRHRTLRAVVDWSWELLSDAERTLLRRLAVFSGGATAEAAAAVCGDPDAFELLTALTDKSLLVVAPDEGEPRYRMLETIKAYGLERLDEAGEREQTRRAHADWFARLAETADPHLRRAEQLEWLALLAADHDNLTSAVRGAIAAGDAALCVRLVVAAGWYWLLGGHRSEGLNLITQVLAVPGEVDEARATAYALYAMFVTAGIGDDREIDSWVKTALEFAHRETSAHPMLRFLIPLQELMGGLRDGAEPRLDTLDGLLTDEDPWLRGHARLTRVRMLVSFGDRLDEAEADARQSLRDLRASGERWGLSLALGTLAELESRRGDLAAAVGHNEEAIAVVSEMGTLEDVLHLRSRQAQLLWLLGDSEAAATTLAAADHDARTVVFPDALAGLAQAKAELARWRGDPATARAELGHAEALMGSSPVHPVFRAMLLYTQAFLDADAGDLPAAAASRREAFGLARNSGDALYLAQMLVGVADQALRQGRPADAARTLAVAATVRGGRDLTQPDSARIEEAARAVLGEAAYEEAFQDGENVTTAEVPALVTSIVD